MSALSAVNIDADSPARRGNSGTIPPVAAALNRPRLLASAGTLFVLAFLAVGGTGTYQYLLNFWNYRGFPPPSDPAFVQTRGSVTDISVASPALGGRRQQVLVFLPPGYATSPARRYPVFYLLHGFPGRPSAFLQTVRAGVEEDILVARHLIRPTILVMPYGSTGTFTDKEWANGAGRNSGWATFVARDVVRAIDARYRTIRSATGRAIGGLSEGGYGALNIALHHPHEFSVVESWSGYSLADNVPSVFHGDRRLLAGNSPLLVLPRVARAVRRNGTYFWLYSGTDDRLRASNVAFAQELQRLHIPYRFFLVRGGHNWALWRGYAAAALRAADRHLPYGRSALASAAAKPTTPSKA